MPFSKRTYRFIVAAVIAIVVVSAVVAATSNDDDQPITGQAFEDCTKAALAANPGGTVTETEIGDGGAAYGVEIRLTDGSQVEVNLDEECVVIGQEADDSSVNWAFPRARTTVGGSRPTALGSIAGGRPGTG